MLVNFILLTFFNNFVHLKYNALFVGAEKIEYFDIV